MKLFGFTVPKMISDLCQPALLYLILNGLGLFFYLIMMMRVNSRISELKMYTMSGFVLNLIIIMVVVYVLDQLCKYNLGKKVAWFIALFPFIVMALMFVAMMCSLIYIEKSSGDLEKIQLRVDDQEREMSDFKGSIQNGLGINSRTKESALNSIVTGEYEGYNLM